MASQAEEQIFRLKHGWGYGRRTEEENRKLAREAADRAVRIARRFPFEEHTRAIPRRLIITMPSDPPAATLARMGRAADMTQDWDHVGLTCDRRKPFDYLDPRDYPMTQHIWPYVKSGAQLADLVRTEELYHRGGVYLDADVEVLRPLEPLLETDWPWVPAEDERPEPDISNFALGFPPRHAAIGMLLNVMLDRLPGPTWWAGPGALRVAMRGRHDVSLLGPHVLCPVNWKDVAELERIHDLSPDELRRSYPHALGVHLYEGSWRSGKSRRTKVDD